MSDIYLDTSAPLYVSVFPTRKTTHGYNIYSSSNTSPINNLIDKDFKTTWVSDINTFNNSSIIPEDLNELNGDYTGTSNFNGVDGEYIRMDCDFASVIDSITFTSMPVVGMDAKYIDFNYIRLFASYDKEIWDELPAYSNSYYINPYRDLVDTNTLPVQQVLMFDNPQYKMYKSYVIVIPKSLVPISRDGNIVEKHARSTQISLSEIQIYIYTYKDVYDIYLNPPTSTVPLTSTILPTSTTSTVPFTSTILPTSTTSTVPFTSTILPISTISTVPFTSTILPTSTITDQIPKSIIQQPPPITSFQPIPITIQPTISSTQPTISSTVPAKSIIDIIIELISRPITQQIHKPAPIPKPTPRPITKQHNNKSTTKEDKTIKPKPKPISKLFYLAILIIILFFVYFMYMSCNREGKQKTHKRRSRIKLKL